MLKIPLINCKIHLELNWNNNCVIYGGDANAGGDDRETTFKITSTNLHVPIVTLSTKDNVNLTKQLNEGFKISVYWNEYNSKIKSKQADKRSFTRFPLDASFQRINRLFVLPFNNILRMMLKFQLAISLIDFKETAIENISSQE